jgi:hypothetical protein
MTKIVRITLIAACILLMPVTGRTQLPPEVQADLLKTKLTTAMREKNFGEVLAIIDKMRALKVPLPGSIDYFEAYAAVETKDWLKAHDRVTAFLKTYGRKHKLYPRALELYAKVEPNVAAARKAAEESAAAEREAALSELNARVDELLENNEFAAARQALGQAIAARQPDSAPDVLAKIDAAERDYSVESQKQEVRERVFSERMGAATSFFAAELDHKFTATFSWRTHERAERMIGDISMAYDQSVRWGGAAARCAIFVRDNHHLTYLEKDNGVLGEKGTRTFKGDGHFDAADMDLTLKWDSEEMPVPHNFSYFRKTKYIDAGAAPKDIFAIEIDRNSEAPSSTYVQKIKRKFRRYYGDGSSEDYSKTWEDEDTRILGSQAQIMRLQAALEYFLATCQCRTGDTYDAFGQENLACSAAPASPPVFTTPKPVYTVPKDQPAPRLSSDQPSQLQEEAN